MRGLLVRLTHVARRHRATAIRSAGLLTAIVVIVAAFTPYSPLERLNSLVFDAYQILKPREPAAESAVVVIDIDDESIRRLGQWPWPRTSIATLIDRLTAEGAAAIGLDIIFSEPDRTSPALAVAQLEGQGFSVVAPGAMDGLDHDKVLADAFARSPVVAGLVFAEAVDTPPPAPKAGFAFGGDDPTDYLPAFEGSVRNLPVLDAAAPGIGVFSFPPALDGIVRQIPLLTRYDRRLYPALSIESLRVAQGASGFLIRSTGAHGEFATGNPGMTALKAGAFEVPTGPDGTIWVYYTQRPQSKMIPAHRLLGPPDSALRADIEGRIVLIGTSAIGLRDLVSTPQQAGLPGVQVHASIIDQIVDGRYITRPDWAVGLEVAAAALFSLLLLVVLPWFPTLSNLLIATNAIALSIAGGWLAFTSYNLLLSPILPVQCSLLVYGIGSGVRLLLSESESRYIRGAFGQYLSPAMVQRLIDHPERLELGGEDRELTLLFCDIRGFTGLSETMQATELTVFLNNFLTPMTDVLMESGATIDKYMGDAIMAFWNAPLDVADHRRRACESVLRMLASLETFNRSLPKPVKVGIGLNTGICCVGNLGSKQRFDYSAIGDPVNVASRIEGLTKQYGLSNMLAQSVAEGVEGLALLEVDRVMVVGRDEATSVYTLLGGRALADSQEFQDLQQRHATFLSLYRSGAFLEAGHKLEAIEEIAPKEMVQVYAEYRDRIRRFSVEPPPAGWNGVHRPEHK